MIPEPDDRTLADDSTQVLRNDGLMGAANVQLFSGASPIHHVIYVINENRSYDQVFGDLAQAGNGARADGDPELAIFGSGPAAQQPGGPAAEHHAKRARARPAFWIDGPFLRELRGEP